MWCFIVVVVFFFFVLGFFRPNFFCNFFPNKLTSMNLFVKSPALSKYTSVCVRLCLSLSVSGCVFVVVVWIWFLNNYKCIAQNTLNIQYCCCCCCCCCNFKVMHFVVCCLLYWFVAMWLVCHVNTVSVCPFFLLLFTLATPENCCQISQYFRNHHKRGRKNNNNKEKNIYWLVFFF